MKIICAHTKMAYAIICVLFIVTIFMQFMGFSGASFSTISTFSCPFSFGKWLYFTADQYDPTLIGSVFLYLVPAIGYLLWWRKPGVFRFMLPALYMVCCWLLLWCLALGGMGIMYGMRLARPEFVNSIPWWLKLALKLPAISFWH